MDWGKLPTRFAIKFNPKREDFVVIKGLAAAALVVWATTMGWLFVIDFIAWADGDLTFRELLGPAGWFICSGACCWQWFRVLIL